MQNFKDYFTATKNIELTHGQNSVFGRSIIQYQIMKYHDVANLKSSNGYIVLLNQRIIIPPSNVYKPGPANNSAYEKYPAIITNQVNINASSEATVSLRGIFPKTLNSSVNTTASHSDGSGLSNTNESSSGSTNTNVNSFGVNVGGGFFGPIPMFNIGADYGHSWENSVFNSSGSSSTTDQQSSDSTSSSMSIKDWSSYGYLDKETVNPSWVWSQSYPWDVLQYNKKKVDDKVDLPDFVQDRMRAKIGDSYIALPPSQLSQFGLDFSMRAGWLLDFPDGITEEEEISFDHETYYYTATSSADSSTGRVTASLQSQSNAAKATYDSGTINLSAYALATIPDASGGNGAAISFTSGQFVYPPSGGESKFKIISAANNLQVQGACFSDKMTTKFDKTPSLTVTFKIADSTEEYSLLMMHWIGEQSKACKLNCTINGKWTNVIYVDTPEGEGGQNNVSALELRNRDFTSINFHDYLVIGTNTIKIDIEPIEASAENSYTLYALAVGQA